MWNRAPLALAAGLFILGAAGLLATATHSWETTAYLGIGRNEPTAAPPDMRSAQAPILPGTLPLAAPTATPTAEVRVERSEPPAAATSTAIPTPTPRPPLFIGAVAADEAHELATPTPGPMRAIMVGRDDGEPTPEASETAASEAGTPEAAPTPTGTPTPDATPETGN